MSEEIHLYEKMLASGPWSDPPPPRASVSVIPWRRDAQGALQVFWVRRSPTMKFMGGWHAFPGGGWSRRDTEVEVTGRPRGLEPGRITDPGPDLDAATRRALPPDDVDGLLAAALRELFEETGLLTVSQVASLDPVTLDHARRRLLAKEIGFRDLLDELGSRLDARSLVFAGRWLTPPLAPVRFDNRFFLLEWPAERERQPDVRVEGLERQELVEGEWISPRHALERWETGAVMAAPPILHVLRVLLEDGPEEGLGRLRDPHEANLGPLRRVEFRPGVVLLPLATATLPPATHTNAFLLGFEEVVLVDPAPSSAGETARLRRAVAAAEEAGKRVKAIWLTHHHPDHVGAVEAMRSALGVPVAAHTECAARLAERGIRVDEELVDRQRIELAGERAFVLRVFHTPGHTRGHLTFYDEVHGSLIAGDLVAGIGTIAVMPPEGDMDQYLHSLERMIELGPKTLFPAHGPAVLQAVEKLEEYRDHRLWREERVLRCWTGGKQALEEMVGEVYDDVPAAAHPLAMRQLEAHLLRLRRLGKIE